MPYYLASCDYDGIDPDSSAAICHFTDSAKGFPNLEIQLAYRGYTIEQLKLKSGIATLGHSIKSYMEGHFTEVYFSGNGRNGVFHEISTGSIIAGYQDSLATHVNEPLATFSEFGMETYPNPFSTSTTIEYELQHPSTVQITIYNHIGKQLEVIQQKQSAGKQQVLWNAEGLPSRVYFCIIKTDPARTGQTIKLIKWK